MANGLAALAVGDAVLFVLTMVLATRTATKSVGELVGTGFHLLLLPLVASLPVGLVGQGSGFAWVVCDVVAATGLVWTVRQDAEVGAAVFTPIRMAGHLFAAIWIAVVSTTMGTFGLVTGCALALGFAAYTLAGGRLPERALAVPGALMVVWLLLLAWHVRAVAA